MRTDTLFQTIEELQGTRPWGRVLDAGTGEHSLGWLQRLDTSELVAVTADERRAAKLGRQSSSCEVVHGNWQDDGFLAGRSFDVVLCDYLLGAIDGFAPYFQDQLFARLRRVCAGRVYVVGLEPYPQRTPDEGGRLVLEIARLRDACILLAGDRCYREYPQEWVSRHLRQAGFSIVAERSFGIRYGARFVDGQLAVCRAKLPRIDETLQAPLRRRVDELGRQAHRYLNRVGTIRFGQDYVIAAEPMLAQPLVEAR